MLEIEFGENSPKSSPFSDNQILPRVVLSNLPIELVLSSIYNKKKFTIRVFILRKQ
jgi:hypothetical protein